MIHNGFYHEKFSNLINNDGKVEKVEELGIRKLAYDIKKQKEQKNSNVQTPIIEFKNVSLKYKGSGEEAISDE